MNGYSIALFFHVAGALGFFATLGLEWISLRHLQRATTAEQVREWLLVPNEVRREGMVSMMALLTSGLYMMAKVWGSVAWIFVTLGAIVLMIILSMAISGLRMKAIVRAVSSEQGAIPHTLYLSLHDPVLWIAMKTRVAMALGIVFLMTVKPNILESLLTIGIAILLGFASALPMNRRERVLKESAD